MDPLTPTAERAYETVAPLAFDDENQDFALATLCQALAIPFNQSADLSRDGDDGSPGYSQVFDPGTLATALLPWLTQFVGAPLSDDETTQRDVIRHVPGWNRGRPSALIGAARSTGATTVFLTERAGSAWRLSVATLSSETADPDATEAAIRAQKPAGIVLTYDAITGGDYTSLRDTHATYADVVSSFATYDDLRRDPTHT